jgi:hypothetical protein
MGQAMRDWREIELEEWSEFAARLSNELVAIGHTNCVAIRNFRLASAIINENSEHLGDVDRLEIVRRTGTDRDDKSDMWNAVGHDYDHVQCPSGKMPADITYAYVAEVNNGDYLVHYQGEPEEFDLTKGLSIYEGILVYDASKLERVSKNEHWFLTSPLEALLLVFTIAQ